MSENLRWSRSDCELILIPIPQFLRFVEHAQVWVFGFGCSGFKFLVLVQIFIIQIYSPPDAGFFFPKYKRYNSIVNSTTRNSHFYRYTFFSFFSYSSSRQVCKCTAMIIIYRKGHQIWECRYDIWLEHRAISRTLSDAI